MANPEHLAILKQGVKAWNKRQETQHFKAELRNADLSLANLSGADLGGANLLRANLLRTNLSGANLSGANLSGANLMEADLSGADLESADFDAASLGWTILVNVDLSRVRGLATARHEGPSSIGIDTIYRSKGNIPEAFLRGAGVPDDFIVYMHSLVANPIDFYSCFISYSSRDQEFAERLHADLQSKGVRCWFAPEDLKIGDRFPERIEESIRLYDKLLLVLSVNSVDSPWVEREVRAAFEKEQRQPGRSVLFPIQLDDSVMGTSKAWAADIRRTRHIGEFSGWKGHDSYQKAFGRLLRDLKAEKPVPKS